MVNGMMKSIALRGCHNLIAELGGAPERVARAAGLSQQAFTDPDMSVDSDAVATYFDLAARHCGVEDFGLKLAPVGEDGKEEEKQHLGQDSTGANLSQPGR